jgi:Ca-activated chloride channel homolog
MSHALPLLTDDQISLKDAPASGFGTLRTEKGHLPLTAMSVSAKITGLVAEVFVQQSFHNSIGEAIEATYIFPLPDRAAVTRFVMTVGGRTIEGAIKERGEARREYSEAIKAGHRAAITEEERAGVFSLRVGNLMPNESAVVELTLTGPLTYSDGEATFRFPLVVAPRYIPGRPLPGQSVGDGVAIDTDAVPDASRISPPVLLPGFPSPVRLDLSAEIDPAGLSVRDLRSSLHAIRTESDGGKWKVKIEPGERLNRDFILRFSVAEAAVSTSLRLEPDASGDGGTFLLTLVPPKLTAASRPRDVVFVLDRSGSMSGWKMVAARRAAARMIDSLTDRDRFSVLAFDDSVESPDDLPKGLADATDRHRFRAVEFLAKVDARGGTEMAEPLSAAADLLQGGYADRDRSLVLVTDGQVGNEDQILRMLAPKLKGVRIFTMGVDTAVNAAFLQRLAQVGGGASELVESEDRLDEVMFRFHRRIGAPVVTELSVMPEGIEVVMSSLSPGRIPDLFEGTPLFISGQFRGRPSGAITLQGADSSGMRWSERVEGRATGGKAIGVLWARARVRELEDRYVIGSGDKQALEREIVDTSLRFSVLCRFTAYVAIDKAERVNVGGQLHKIVQPVEAPDGWAMFGAKGAPGGGAMNASVTRAGAMKMKASMQIQAPESFDFADDEEPADALAAPPPAPPMRARAPAPRMMAQSPYPAGPASSGGMPPPSFDAYKDRARRLLDAAKDALARAKTEDDRRRALGVLRLGLEALLADLRSVLAPPAMLYALRDLIAGLTQQPADADPLLRDLDRWIAGGTAEERRDFWK